MPILPWSDMLSVGVKAIDRQHHALVDILNTLGEVVLGQRGAWDESVALSKLVQYTETHFAYEEALMQKLDYAGREAHIEEHRRLFQQVAELMSRCTDGQPTDPQELVIFLRDWLSAHIMGTDRELGLAVNRAQRR
jgi:hemerythrin-like metal-binding protein